MYIYIYIYIYMYIVSTWQLEGISASIPPAAPGRSGRRGPAGRVCIIHNGNISLSICIYIYRERERDMLPSSLSLLRLQL